MKNNKEVAAQIQPNLLYEFIPYLPSQIRAGIKPATKYPYFPYFFTSMNAFHNACLGRAKELGCKIHGRKSNFMIIKGKDRRVFCYIEV